MAKTSDPTEEMREFARELPDVVEGESCNQTSFKRGKKSFFFVGPGAKGIGFKSMFKLDESMASAEKLAVDRPDEYEVGKSGWVTARFSIEKPLGKRLWKKWIKESYNLSK